MKAEPSRLIPRKLAATFEAYIVVLYLFRNCDWLWL